MRFKTTCPYTVHTERQETANNLHKNNPVHLQRDQTTLQLFLYVMYHSFFSLSS